MAFNNCLNLQNSVFMHLRRRSRSISRSLGLTRWVRVEKWSGGGVCSTIFSRLGGSNFRRHNSEVQTKLEPPEKRDSFKEILALLSKSASNQQQKKQIKTKSTKLLNESSALQPPEQEATQRPTSSSLPVRNLRRGLVYRRYPILTNETGPETQKEAVIPPEGYEKLHPGSTQLVIPPPANIPIPRLAHGLQRVLFNEGIHPLRDLVTQKFNFTPFLSKIHQPNEINYDALPPFVTSSKDKVLHQLASANGCTFVGSTSSVGPILSQLYLLFSNFRSLDMRCLPSYRYGNKEYRFTKTTIKPVSVVLRKKDGVYSIDSDPGNILVPKNKILLDLGKSLERMLTTDPAQFMKLYLRSHYVPMPIQPDAYHYLKVK
jgi:hypothetical protein